MLLFYDRISDCSIKIRTEPYPGKIPSVLIKSVIKTEHTCIMIELFSEFGKCFSQDFYDEVVNDALIPLLKCPSCRHTGCLIKFGKYKRSIKSEGVIVRLSIQRVICKECSDSNHLHTHALIPADIVPYSQVPMKDQLDIIIANGSKKETEEILDRNPLLDMNYVYRLLILYRSVWEARIISENILLREATTTCRSCFSLYSMQFMQIKKIPICLFLPST